MSDVSAPLAIPLLRARPGRAGKNRHPEMTSEVPELLVRNKNLPANPDHASLETIDPMPLRHTAEILEGAVMRHAPAELAHDQGWRVSRIV